MRVLHLVSASHRRGAERVARSLVDALDPDIEGRLIAIVPGSAEAGSLAVDEVLVPKGARRRWTWLPRALWKLRRELKRFQPDVVVAHGALTALVAVCPVAMRRPPVVWHRILELPARPRTHPANRVLQLVARRVDGAIAITHKTADETRALGFRGPVWRIPNHREPSAAPDHRTVMAFRESLGLHDEPLIVSINHLVAQKNPVDTVHAFDIAAQGHPAAHLIVVGDGPALPSVTAAAQASAARDRIHLLGHRDDVPTILAAADLVVSSSASDSMPGALIEAQLAGCPVVTYPVDGALEIIDHDVTGFVVERAEPVLLAGALSALIADGPRRETMAQAARQRSSRLATWAVLPRYRAVFRTMSRARSDRILILHVLPDLGVGGAETALAVLARTLPDHIDQLVAAIGGARRPLAETVHDDLQAAGVGYCDLGIRRRPTTSAAALLLATLRLRRLAVRLGVDITDAALLDAALPLRLAPMGTRRVTHLVNTTYEPVVRDAVAAKQLRFRLVQAIDAISARRDDAFVAITEAVGQSARRRLRLPQDRVHVIPRGVELCETARRAPAAGALHAVSVGRLVQQKGHETAIAAIAAARDCGVDVRLSIAGEGPLLAHLRAVASANEVSGAVEFLGPVRDVRALLEQADLFLLPSRWEGQSNALLEAMALGLPVLVSDVPALAEVVGDAGLPVDAEDANAWGQQIQRLAHDADLRQRLGDHARRRVEVRYDATQTAAELSRLYESLLGHWRPRD